MENNKIIVSSINSNNHYFVIQSENTETDLIEYFSGFFNEIECLGTEDECQCWENEAWTSEINYAEIFNTYSEALSFKNNVQRTSPQYNINILLVGIGAVKNIDGTNFYPLKVFK